MKDTIKYFFLSLIIVVGYAIFLSIAGFILYLIVANNFIRTIFFVSFGIFFMIVLYETIKELINDYRRKNNGKN